MDTIRSDPLFQDRNPSTIREMANAGKLPLAQYMRLSEIDTDGWHDTMIAAMARHAFMIDWADENERKRDEGRKYVNTSGMRIEDVAPSRTPPRFKTYAKKLAAQYKAANGGMPIEELFVLAMAADPKVDSDQAEDFASDLVWMAQGSGASWFDDHKEFDLNVP